ncbi:AMP-binding protein [soil metagenome]
MAPSKYRVLAALMRNERRSLPSLIDLQNRQLRRLVHHAWEHVPFYRRLFDEAGTHPSAIRVAADLEKLPVIDKDLLRAQPPGTLVDRRLRRDALIERHTSGSSGSPFRFFVDEAFDTWCKAQYLRPYISNGRRPFDSVLRFTAFAEQKPRRWFHRFGMLRETLIASSRPPDILLDALRESHADIVQGYPSVLSAIAGMQARTHAGFPQPRLVFTDSELLAPSVRRQIEQAFDAPVFDVFGAYETDNIGYECAEHSGYHLAIDCVVAEFVRDGRAVRAGESGELVCTVLNNYAMPLIRYNLQDIAAASPAPCACGRSLPMMSVVEGRFVDCAVLADGSRVSPMQFLGKLDAIDDVALEYQVVQTAVDEFRVTLVPRGIIGAAERERVAQIIRAQHGGARVTIAEAPEIEREASGKRRTFICEI